MDILFVLSLISMILGFLGFLVTKIYVSTVPKEHYEFIVDQSSSMNEKINNYTKFDIAKEALEKHVASIPFGIRDTLSLRLFGGHCGIHHNKVYNFNQKNNILNDFLYKLKRTRPEGKSNLIATIKHTMEDLKNKYRPKKYNSDFVVITSGDDSCSEIPIDLLSNRIRSMYRYNFKINFHFIGILDNGENDKKVKLAAIADMTGGFVKFAENKEELWKKLEEIKNDKEPEAINGLCGIMSGSALNKKPTADIELCRYGIPPNDVKDNIFHWSWTCKGLNGGADNACCATKVIKPPKPPVNNRQMESFIDKIKKISFKDLKRFNGKRKKILGIIDVSSGKKERFYVKEVWLKDSKIFAMRNESGSIFVFPHKYWLNEELWDNFDIRIMNTACGLQLDGIKIVSFKNKGLAELLDIKVIVVF